MSSPLSAPFSVFPQQTHTSTSKPHRRPSTSSGIKDKKDLNINTRIPTFPSPPTSTAPSPASYHSAAMDGYPFPSVWDEQAAKHRPTRPELRPHDIPTSTSLESLPRITTCPRRAQTPSPKITTSSTGSSATSSTASSPTSSLKKFKWPTSPLGGGSGRKEPKRSTSTTMRCGRHGDEWLGLRGWRFWR